MSPRAVELAFLVVEVALVVTFTLAWYRASHKEA